MAMSDLKFDSKALVLGCASVGKAELINAVKLGNGNKAIETSAQQHQQSESIDYRYEEFSLPLVDKENVFSSEVHFDTFISCNRVNHSLNLKNAYKTAEYIVFVFDIANRQSFEDLNRYMNDYLVLGRRPNASILLIGHHQDISQERKVTTEEIIAWSSVTRTESAIRYIECSAKSGSGILEVISFLSEQYQSAYWAALTTHSDKTVSFGDTLSPTSSEPVLDWSGANNTGEDAEDVDASDAEHGKKKKLEQFEKSMADSIARDRKELGTSSTDPEDHFDPAVLLSNISCFFTGSSDGGNGSSPRHSVHSGQGQQSPRGSAGSHSARAEAHKEVVAIDWNNVKSIIEMSYDDTEESNKRVRNNEEYTLKSKRTASTEITSTDVDGIYSVNSKGEQGCWDSFKCTRWWECLQIESSEAAADDHRVEHLRV